jgi:hypothetical protein
MKTKKSSIVAELKDKHKERLGRASRELKKDKRLGNQCLHSPDVLLFSKWAYRVGKGWYGFDLGDVPRVWGDVLDDFLSWLETQCPDFEIHQIKIKVGRLRVYIGTKTRLFIPDEKIRSEISRLEDLLSLPPLPQRSLRADRKKRRKQLPRKSTKAAK